MKNTNSNILFKFGYLSKIKSLSKKGRLRIYTTKFEQPGEKFEISQNRLVFDQLHSSHTYYPLLSDRHRKALLKLSSNTQAAEEFISMIEFLYFSQFKNCLMRYFERSLSSKLNQEFLQEELALFQVSNHDNLILAYPHIAFVKNNHELNFYGTMKMIIMQAELNDEYSSFTSLQYDSQEMDDVNKKLVNSLLDSIRNTVRLKMIDFLNEELIKRKNYLSLESLKRNKKEKRFPKESVIELSEISGLSIPDTKNLILLLTGNRIRREIAWTKSLAQLYDLIKKFVEQNPNSIRDCKSLIAKNFLNSKTGLKYQNTEIGRVNSSGKSTEFADKCTMILKQIQKISSN